MSLLTGIVVVLAFLTITLVVKIFEASSKLRDQKHTMVDRSSNNLNSILMLTFLILGMIGAYLVNDAYKDVSLYAIPSVTPHGVEIDWMFDITLLVCAFVTIVCNIALFWFAYKYKHREGNKAYYFTHNNKLEIVWTVIPAIVMTYLIVNGAGIWIKTLMTPPPDDAYVIEVTGKQFAWKIRYPGKDGKLGKTIPAIRNPENELGMDPNDPNGQDDIIVGGASGYYMPVNKPIVLKINALDVLHAVYLPHFRVKMDAVPGMQTQFWFIPEITTAQMREKIGNEDFVFEMACAELCGKSHFAMKAVVYVTEQDEVDAWLSKQKTWSEKQKERQMAAKQ